MNTIDVFRRQGWRRTAVINTALISALTVTLAILVVVIVSRTGSINSSLFFYQGACDASNRLNISLHLVINIIATGIIASSSFFMQVLNSPSRNEVDMAHRQHKLLDIGVQSVKNLFHISRFKVISIAVFGISSLPIHLLFNSAVFATDYLGGSWDMTLAAEPFVQGAEFTAPGAYLAPSGFWPLDYPGKDMSYLGQIGVSQGFGTAVSLSEYRNISSPAVQNITKAATAAAGWAKLDPLTCRQQYIYCEPRNRYGNVVMVMNTKGESNTTGWTRSEVFKNMTTANTDFWDDFGIRGSQENALWWAAQCRVWKEPNRGAGVCTSNCAKAIGGDDNYLNSNNLPPFPVLSTDANWTIVNESPLPTNWSYFSGRIDDLRAATLPLQNRTGFDFDNFSEWEIRYCLAEEVRDKCKVGVSGALLLVVMICALLKTVQCFVVLYNLNEDPLVTPGDAIESFIVQPDLEARSMCTVGSTDFHAKNWRHGEDASTLCGPRPWKRSARLLRSAMRPLKWVTTYILFAVALLIAGIYFTKAVSEVEGKLTDRYKDQDKVLYTGFDHSYQNGLFGAMWMPQGRLLPSIVVANTPQVILSICYFMYNSIWTRLCSELEWNSFSLTYMPLRVSNPKGQQVSTYRLQLPYLYSIPLIVGSILLHWLVSNAFYVLLLEGDYLEDKDFVTEDSMGFNGKTYINIGYSTGPMLAGIIACSIIAALPLSYALIRKLKGDMPVAGNKSLVISAACHVTSGGGARMLPLSPMPRDALSEREKLAMNSTYSSVEVDAGLEDRIAMSLGKLKWGVVDAKPRLYEYTRGHEVVVGHLAFGGEDEAVGCPEVGWWYE